MEKFDGLCVLPINVMNEKIYVFLWFWFIILAIVTGVQIVYRLGTMKAPRLREVLLWARARPRSRKQVKAVCRRRKLGDWFLLYQLGKNIDPLIFHEFIGELYKAEEMPEGEEGLP